jgi:hypothetical protein
MTNKEKQLLDTAESLYNKKEYEQAKGLVLETFSISKNKKEIEKTILYRVFFDEPFAKAFKCYNNANKRYYEKKYSAAVWNMKRCIKLAPNPNDFQDAETLLTVYRMALGSMDDDMYWDSFG